MRAVPFINLRPGDKVEMELEDGGLVLRRKSRRRAAKLKRGKFGRPVLVAAEGTPPMTTEAVTALIEKLP